MATTTYYGWTTPNDTDLVKNGASAIRTLGSAVDSSLWTAGYSAGKNKIINGDFGIWQRGTSITFADNAYTADRFIVQINSGSAGTGTVSQQTFTAGTAPVSGYEGQFFWRYNLTATGTSVLHYVAQRIENVRTFANQTVTFSFWGKADSARTINSEILQIFGSGGSSAVVTSGATHSFTASWQRFSVTISVPSISGKTIGTGSYLQPRFYWSAAAGATIDTWGWQLEAGSTATPFQTATGTIQGELAACQRYYYRTNPLTQAYQDMVQGQAASTTDVRFILRMPTTMRTIPSAIEYSTLRISDYNTNIAVTSLGGSLYTPDSVELQATVTGATQFRPYILQANNSTSAYVAVTAEL